MREGADQARQTSVTSIDLCELSTEATCMIVVQSQRRKKITKVNQKTFESHIDSVVVVPVILILTSIHIASACRAKRKYETKLPSIHPSIHPSAWATCCSSLRKQPRSSF
ncbi:uncharacterized protein RAG0_07682 [Rhynchosporium agropyri]|uniref:Uncharacterized protein n=1 Tax=Rhynchosporium agropyri TaxID=914238 RepID=A0A1E1KMS4_9HELO|nr:uncharacterized protein RAG0_07682 [Rhynchosporium agropyri]